MCSRDEIKALTDKALNMAKADAVDVAFDGGERSATRWANSYQEDHGRRGVRVGLGIRD